MAFTRIYDGKATLEELERACLFVQTTRTANLTSIVGRNAKFDDGTKINVNVITFDPQDTRAAVRASLSFVKETDADVTFRNRMVTEHKTQIGEAMNIFVAGTAVKILAFGTV